MKYLIVKPLGGLANRIRVLEASYNFAHAHQAKIIIIWDKSGFLNAAYDECFEPLDEAHIFNFDNSGRSFFSKFKRKGFDIIEATIRFFYVTSKSYEPDIEPFLNDTKPTEKSKIFFDDIAQKNKGVFIETCYEFYPNLLSYQVHVKKGIKLKAHHLLATYPSLIGIHIRRTDHVESIMCSPTQKFIDEINRSLARKPDIAFYLSTDSDEVVHVLKNQFKEKIITGVSIRNRDSKEGINAALIDLCCLSQCKKILGSYRSSFSERAAIMGNIPLQIVSA